jgi:hypothetical protein
VVKRKLPRRAQVQCVLPAVSRSFLSERLDTEIHMQGSLLTLTEAQAGAVLALAFRIDAGPTVNPIEAGDEASEAEQINTRS